MAESSFGVGLFGVYPSNSKQSANAISVWIDHSGLSKIHSRFTQDLNKVNLYFIKRSANRVAHEFARAAFTFSDQVFDRWSAPFELQQCIVEDLGV